METSDPDKAVVLFNGKEQLRLVDHIEINQPEFIGGPQSSCVARKIPILHDNERLSWALGVSGPTPVITDY